MGAYSKDGILFEGCVLDIPVSMGAYSMGALIPWGAQTKNCVKSLTKFEECLLKT